MQHDDKEEARRYKESLKVDKEEQLHRDFAVRGLLKTYEGRRYLWWLLQISNYNITPFSRDGIQMGFNCGEQNIGLQVLAHIIEVEPAGFIQMQQENLNGRRTKPEPDTGTDSDAEDSGGAG